MPTKECSITEAKNSKTPIAHGFIESITAAPKTIASVKSSPKTLYSLVELVDKQTQPFPLKTVY